MSECIDLAVFSVGGADAQAVVMCVCPSVYARTEREAEKKQRVITCGIRTNSGVRRYASALWPATPLTDSHTCAWT
jgi:hypothetical protein